MRSRMHGGYLGFVEEEIKFIFKYFNYKTTIK